MSKHELEGKFNPKDFEDEIYENWEKKGYFKPSNDKSKKPYTIVIPPPNITVKLHMGHALDETLQDILNLAENIHKSWISIRKYDFPFILLYIDNKPTWFIKYSDEKEWYTFDLLP